MKIRFKTWKGPSMWANMDEASSLEEAALVYNRLHDKGFAVIPYDEDGREYWMNSEGKLMHKAQTPPG